MPLSFAAIFAFGAKLIWRMWTAEQRELSLLPQPA
jgi:hypothetical protein